MSDEARRRGRAAPDGRRARRRRRGASEISVLPPAEMRAVLEALIFASDAADHAARDRAGAGRRAAEAWQAALDELQADYARDGRGLQLVEVAGGWQITTRPEYNDWVRELLDPQRPTRLSIQALETLAVIAYKQPVTQPEVIELRGVKSGGVLKTLLEKRLIRITGRKEVVGRPMLYGTTKEFLLHFGLKDLSELPKIEEFAEVLGEEVDVAGLKRAIEAPAPGRGPPGRGGRRAARAARSEWRGRRRDARGALRRRAARLDRGSDGRAAAEDPLARGHRVAARRREGHGRGPRHRQRRHRARAGHARPTSTTDDVRVDGVRVTAAAGAGLPRAQQAEGRRHHAPRPRGPADRDDLVPPWRACSRWAGSTSAPRA